MTRYWLSSRRVPAPKPTAEHDDLAAALVEIGIDPADGTTEWEETVVYVDGPDGPAGVEVARDAVVTNCPPQEP